MPAIQFYNFGNNATYHFFTWITEAGVVDPDALIGQAFDDAAGNPWAQPDGSVSYAVCEQLAELLREVLDGQMSDFDMELIDYQAIGDIVKENPMQSLFYPLLNLALEEIDFDTVAQAILMRANKWAPDKEPPPLI